MKYRIIYSLLKSPSSTSTLTPERGIEKLWNTAHDRIFGTQEKLEKTKDNITKKMQIINVAYNLAKLKFEGKERVISKEWYFEHLRETAYILIGSGISKNVSIYQVVLALLHDILEDTNMTYEGLIQALSDSISTDLAEKIANGVRGLTKNNWHNYISSPQDKAFVKWYEDDRKTLNGSPSFLEEKEVSQKQKDKYDLIKRGAKNLRDIDYNNRLEQLDDETLEVKFSDRLHNLRTQWDPNNKKQVVKKIKETKNFYIPLAFERNMTAHNLLIKEVSKLEKKLGFSVETNTCINITKSGVEQVINPGTL